MSLPIVAANRLRAQKQRLKETDDEEDEETFEYEIDIENEDEPFDRPRRAGDVAVGLRKNKKQGEIEDIVSRFQKPFSTPRDDRKRVRNFLLEEDIPTEVLHEAGPTTHIPNCLILPNGKLRSRWDMLVLLALAFTALVTPVETTFLDAPLSVAEALADPLFWINRVVDLVFVFDIGLNFITPVYSSSQGRMVWTHAEIALVYARFWLWIDTVSVIPFDIIALVSEDEELGKLAGLSVLRLLRLAKLLRIFRASRIIRRWESAISISHNKLQLARFAATIILLAHWMACGLKLVEVLESVSPNWLTAYFEDDFGLNLTSVSWESQYVVALYWAVMTITTIGYGDVSPVTDTERWYTVVAMLFGGSVYAYIIGSVCAIVASMDEIETHFHQRIDHLNKYMRDNEVPKPIRWKVREFFFDSKNSQKRKGTAHLLHDLSPDMQKQLALHVKKDAVNAVPFIRSSPDEEKQVFLMALALELKERVYPSLENIAYPGEKATELMIVGRGAVLFNRSFFLSPKLNPMLSVNEADNQEEEEDEEEGEDVRAQLRIEKIMASVSREVLTEGDYFGEEMILHATPRGYHVVSLTYTELHTLNQTSLKKILTKYALQLPVTVYNLRWHRYKLAFAKRVISALSKTRREIDEGVVRQPSRTFSQTTTMPEGTTVVQNGEEEASLETIVHKMNVVLEQLDNSRRKIESLEMLQREKVLELEDQNNTPKYTYLNELKPPRRFKRI